MTTNKGMMRLVIGSNPPKDISEWGLELIKSPEMFGNSIKESNIVTVDFPEQDGVEVYLPENPKAQAFDYTVTLAFYSDIPKLSAARIGEFCNELKGKNITVFNDYKGVRLDGIFKSYADGEFFPDFKVVTFSVTFFIAKPQSAVSLNNP